MGEPGADRLNGIDVSPHGSNEDPGGAAGEVSLLCRVESLLCALPLGSVVETMRPLPVVPLADAPSYVRGISLIRGAPVPVVDFAALLGRRESRPNRLVTVVHDGRTLALTVDAVLGIRTIDTEQLLEPSALLGDHFGEVVSAVGSLDAGLLSVLRVTRLIPDSVWAAADETAAAS